jgi:WD40 repeat protein
MHVRNRIRVLGTPNPGYTYQATAISADCKKVALVSLADFVIHEVTSTFESQIVCWGDNTKRFAPQPKITVEQKSITSYHIAALSNRVLAIASQEAFVDIRNAGTGERINLLRLDPSDLICRTLDFSPDGQHLAVGFENGDVLIFQAGLLFDFAGETPIRLRYKEGGFHKIPVVSVAFSHDSSLMAICTKDNVVRCYRLDHLSDGFFEEYDEPATYGKRGSPADISDLALYGPFCLATCALY